jgi:hypothetical protein
MTQIPSLSSLDSARDDIPLDSARDDIPLDSARDERSRRARDDNRTLLYCVINIADCHTERSRSMTIYHSAGYSKRHPLCALDESLCYSTCVSNSSNKFRNSGVTLIGSHAGSTLSRGTDTKPHVERTSRSISVASTGFWIFA